MKKFVVFLLATAFVAPAVHATCVGSQALSNCWDDNGNNYTVQRMGNMTYVDGSNSRTGSQWSETVQHYGDTAYINGTDKRGRSWSEVCTSAGCY